MRYHTYMKALRGMSLIDVIVGSAMILIVFVALIGLLRASVLITGVSKARAGATAIAETQMEYIRGLSYDTIGTTNGVPSGVVMATSTQVLNNITYNTRTFIAYIDDPADGLGAADTNGINTDYKRAKVEVTYLIKGEPRDVSLISNIAPESIESTTNGGTLIISVVGAAGIPIPGATVSITNASTSPIVNFSTFSDASGLVQLPGAPTSTEYRISVSKSGYSSAQTYTRDATNQNPTPGYLTVVKGQTTTGTFAIDTLASLTISTWYPILPASTTDSFSSSANLATQTNTEVSGNALRLQFGADGYALSGSAEGNTVSPTLLSSWTSASSTVTTPAGTAVRVHVVTGAGVLVPDSVIPGNSAGFTSFPILLSGVSTTTYPNLGLSADLTTNSTTTTPSITDWQIDYMVGPTPVPNVSFTLSGAKTIGSTGAGAAIYKTSIASSTSASGWRTIPLEWDSYELGLSSYDVVDACTPPAYVVAPGATYSSALYLGAATTNTALVSVHDNVGAPISGASVTVSRSGFSETVASTGCGTAYFGGLTNATYTITASKAGYTTVTYTAVPISGHIFYDAVFP